MERRSFIGLGTVAFTGLTGCLGTQRPDQQNTPPPTPTPKPVDFELVSFDLPEKVELDTEVIYEFEVKNTSDRAATFETTVSTKKGTGDWVEGSKWSGEIPAGESKVFKSQEFMPRYLADWVIRVDKFGEVRSMTVGPATRSIGRYFEVWNETAVSVGGIKFSDKLEGDEYTYEPDEGMRFLRILVDAENGSSEIRALPSPSNFDIVAGDRQYEPALYQDASEYYSGGEVQPGISRTGYITFQVPTSVTKENATAVWSRNFAQGDVAVYWQQN